MTLDPNADPASGFFDAPGDPAREYETAHERVAVIASPWRSLLSIRGPDAVAFLNGMLTQDILRMVPGEVLPACQVDRMGHILADILVQRLHDGALLDVPASRGTFLSRLYERHRIMEDARIEPMTMGGVLFCGRRTPELLERLRESGWPALESPEPGRRIWSDEPRGLIARALAAGAELIGGRTLDRLRIEAGRPWYGRDMDETHFPQEVRLDHAVSTGKGCYLGQETLARIHFRGHVRRSLCGIRIPGPPPAAGTEVRVDGRAVGRISSVAGPPGQGDSLGLALLRIEHQTDGARVEVEGRQAFVASLPFREERL